VLTLTFILVNNLTFTSARDVVTGVTGVIVVRLCAVCTLIIKMATYTCITCRVMFADKDGSEGCAAELQKAHYKTDWHRYNLKRKVADLPPVTAENFQQRVFTQREQVLYDKMRYGMDNICLNANGSSLKIKSSTVIGWLFADPRSIFISQFIPAIGLHFSNFHLFTLRLPCSIDLYSVLLYHHK